MKTIASEKNSQARRIPTVLLALPLLVLAVPLQAASALLTANLDCSGPGSGWHEDDYGWQSLDFNVELRFILRGALAQMSGDFRLHQLSNQTGSEPGAGSSVMDFS